MKRNSQVQNSKDQTLQLRPQQMNESPEKEVLMVFNKKNRNGRVYTPESFVRNRSQVLVTSSGLTEDFQLADVCGGVEEIEVVGDTLVGKFFPMGNYSRLDGTVIRPILEGKVDDTGKVSEAEIRYFVVTSKENDPFYP